MNKTKMQGILYIILAGFFFSFMTFFVRLSGDVPTMQKVFFRNLVAAFVAIIILARSEEGFKIKKISWPSLAMRCICGTAGMICNFYAIGKLGLADSNMLNKLSPFFAIILSYFVLKEKANKTEWLCVLVAFTGALFIIKPSFQMDAFYGFIGLLGGLGAGVAYTYVRKLGILGERGPVIVMCFSVFSCLTSGIYCAFTYEPMPTKAVIYLLLSGVFATGGQLSITAAYQKAPAKEISVYDYSQILFATTWGMLFLGETPDIYSIIGYIIIIGCAVFKWRYTLKKSKEEAMEALAKNNLPKAVLFDLDGTILDTEKYYRVLWPKALKKYGYELKDEMALTLRSLGRPFAPRQFKDWFGEDFDYDKVRGYRKEIFKEMVEEYGIQKKPGVEEILAFLKKNGITTAICTATDLERTNTYLEAVGLTGAFDKLISATMVEKGKPAPDVYLFAVEKLGYKPSECIAVEDAPNGIKSAYAAGLKVIMVPDQTEPDEELQKMLFGCVDSLDQIVDLLENTDEDFN